MFIDKSDADQFAARFNSGMIARLEKRAVRAMIDGRGRNEADFAKGLVAAFKRGNFTVLQKAHTVRLVEVYCQASLAALLKTAPSPVAPAPVAPAPAVPADLMSMIDLALILGPRLGAGVYRKGFALSFVVKTGKNADGIEQCKLEAERFLTAPAEYKRFLCPSLLLPGGSLLMVKVDGYVDSGFFRIEQTSGKIFVLDRENPDYKREVTRENYEGILETACHYCLWDNGKNRLQGGFLGNTFVMTDYAL